ncbi:uncharacterized protein MYCFIDRAFT_169623 [Pseudocercospora fijiensis CIRAD86]|uniref:Uncharacterized protein n=1 Tax=Pseudocercospora fijiensis (strain CIRAD86) TaxID=383855 RepID=N1Q817_PSEFD|nr:uncharacterized protein MYCFIDRAFT_169623 [Pseudocercospora fijiensis CIRAD86]EME87891.1 hypothetical protein MYCFIDRAFT_169623 [Pseudocercospora fijiensis CIRAD86]
MLGRLIFSWRKGRLENVARPLEACTATVETKREMVKIPPNHNAHENTDLPVRPFHNQSASAISAAWMFLITRDNVEATLLLWPWPWPSSCAAQRHRGLGCPYVSIISQRGSVLVADQIHQLRIHFDGDGLRIASVEQRTYQGHTMCPPHASEAQSHRFTQCLIFCPPQTQRPNAISCMTPSQNAFRLLVCCIAALYRLNRILLTKSTPRRCRCMDEKRACLQRQLFHTILALQNPLRLSASPSFICRTHDFTLSATWPSPVLAMATPLYIKGLAASGKFIRGMAPLVLRRAHGRDAPFHELEAQMASSDKTEIRLSGSEASEFISNLAVKGQNDLAVYSIPFDCPDAIEHHVCDTPGSCNHSMQCGVNSTMWRPTMDQKIDPATGSFALFYGAHLSDGLAQHLINFMVEDTENVRSQLSTLLQAYGDLIAGCSVMLLLEFLANGRCNMGTHTRSHHNYVTLTRCPNDDCYDEHYESWSGGEWLSLRDLANDPMKLLSLLHVRTSNSSMSWTIFDVHAACRAWAAGYFPAWYNEHCVTMCDAGYGELCSFDVEATHRWAIVGFPRAFVTIQAQHELMCTLLRITHSIVDESPPTGSTTWSALVTNGLRASGGDAAWSSYKNQAFASPATFSSKLVLDKARTQFRMIQDEFWLLQTDPRYFQDLIRSRRMTIGNIAMGMRQRDQEVQVGGLLIDELITRFHLWYTVVQGCEEFHNAVERHENGCRPGVLLPLELSALFTQTRHLITSRLRKARDSFVRIMGHTGCVEDHEHDQLLTSGGAMQLDIRKGLDPYAPAGRLQWRMQCLAADATHGREPMYGYAYVLDALMREDREAKLMDKSMLDLLGDFMLLDDLHQLFGKAQLVADRQWQTVYFDIPPIYKASTCSDWRMSDDECMKQMRPLLAKFIELRWPKVRGIPGRAFLHSQETKDVAWLERAIECRQRLGDLWKGIKSQRARLALTGCRDLAVSVATFKAAISYDTEPEYLTLVNEERKLYDLERSRMAAVAKAELLQAEEQEAVWKSALEHGPVCHKQTKAKARRVNGMTQSSSSDESTIERSSQPSSTNESSHAETHLQTLKVRKESLSVFRKMFSPAGAQSDTRWVLFVQAMVDAGFKATEASGSAVNFSNGSGSICFHRPHPEPTIDHIMLHNMARRLQKGRTKADRMLKHCVDTFKEPMSAAKDERNVHFKCSEEWEMAAWAKTKWRHDEITKYFVAGRVMSPEN